MIYSTPAGERQRPRVRRGHEQKSRCRVWSSPTMCFIWRDRVPKYGRLSPSCEGRQNLTAPMPGKVVRVLLHSGDEVSAGQGVVVVEAMKMQNEIKSPKTGRVIEVRVAEGATVTANQVLAVVE